MDVADLLASGSIGGIVAAVVTRITTHFAKKEVDQLHAERLKDYEAKINERLAEHKSGLHRENERLRAALQKEAQLEIERQKIALQAELETAKADLKRSQDRWSWLDERMITSLVELHEGLVDLRGTYLSVTMFPSSQDLRDQMMRLAGVLAQRLQKAAIYLDEDTHAQLDRLRSGLGRITFFVRQIGGPPDATNPDPQHDRLFALLNEHESELKLAHARIKSVLRGELAETPRNRDP